MKEGLFGTVQGAAWEVCMSDMCGKTHSRAHRAWEQTKAKQSVS